MLPDHTFWHKFSLLTRSSRLPWKKYCRPLTGRRLEVLHTSTSKWAVFFSRSVRKLGQEHCSKLRRLLETKYELPKWTGFQIHCAIFKTFGSFETPLPPLKSSIEFDRSVLKIMRSKRAWSMPVFLVHVRISGLARCQTRQIYIGLKIDCNLQDSGKSTLFTNHKPLQ